MTEATLAAPTTPSPFDDPSGFDPLEVAMRGRVRAFIEHLLEEELEAALGRRRYERVAVATGRRHGHRAPPDHHVRARRGGGPAGAPRRR